MSNKLQPRVIQDQFSERQISGDCNCDCACAVSISVVRTKTLLADLDIIRSSYPRDFHTTWLNADYTVCYTPFTRLAVLNRAAFDILVHSQCTTGNAFTNLCSCTSEQLCVWLHLTNQCNLGCAYCYLSNTRAGMSSVTGHATIDATFRSALAHDYRLVKLKYAGGEPLLCFPLILDLHRYAQSLAEKHDIGLDGVILSNGTLLTLPMVEQMQAAGLRLMISLDGIGAMHDCQRHYADGRGSFDQVARAIDLALGGGLVPDISITISGRNAKGLPDVVAWVLERGLPFSLNFYRDNEQSDSRAGLQFEDEQIIEGMLAAYKVIESTLPRHSLLTSLVDRANLSAPHLRACSVGQNYLVFDTQGRVVKCQMDIANPITDYHDLDPLATLRNNMTGMYNPSVDEKDGCSECQWRYWCGGGCPLQAYHTTGRYDAKSPYCNIYQALFPQVIRLEGLRLLKYVDDPALA